jgi:nicotinamide-nucleotide amidase
MTALPADLTDKARAVLAACRRRRWMAAAAESCTGGLLMASLTAVAGSSDVVDRGYVTYSNEAKTDLLGVAPEMIAEHGAVSAEVARAMAAGALGRSRAGIAIAITGIAGPGGGRADKPVGLVHFACAVADRPPLDLRQVFPGDRDAVRHQAVLAALDLMLAAAEATEQPE